MQRISPPRHRHDGTSPLPLGMDWSPPPQNWDGRNTVWPHDPHTGWSYCVMVPSWIVQTKSKASNGSLLNPIVFYRIQVGIQSPGGFSSIHGILCRFSDFLKLHSALKRAFPKKDIPPAPPKHALLRINSSRLLLEERRRALEEWMGKLLSDIDLSRSAPVAAFLDLEVAARSSFQDTSQPPLETSHLNEASVITSFHPERSSSDVSPSGSATIASKSQSVTSNIESDTAYEASELGSSSHAMVNVSKNDTEIHEFSFPVRQISNGVHNGKFSQELKSEPDHDKFSGHSRKLSAESSGSDVSSLRFSELSNPGITNSMWDGSVDLFTREECRSAIESLNGVEVQILLPFDQQHKLNRVIATMQQRLVTAKTDMEDLIARLNQEMTLQDYLATKVKDLEEELEVTKQKGKENLQQAILTERERVTHMQWDMDELRRKYMEMESKPKIEQSEKTRVELEKSSASSERELLLQQLDGKHEQIDKLQRQLEGVEMKSKADIKILVKEVKFLRSSHAELKEMLNQSMKEKTELEKVLQKEKQIHSKSARKKLLHEFEVLRHQLQECSINFLAEEEDKYTLSPLSLSDALEDLATSDNRIGLLIAEAQLLAHNDEQALADSEKSIITDSCGNHSLINGDEPIKADDEMRIMLMDTLIDNARLRMQVNFVIRRAFKGVGEQEKDNDDGEEVPSRKTVLNSLLER